MNTTITTLHKRVKEFLQQFCYINLKSLWISYSICLKIFDFSKPRKAKNNTESRRDYFTFLNEERKACPLTTDSSEIEQKLRIIWR